MRSEKGHCGGWRLTADLETITLLDICRALGKTSSLAIGHRSDHSDCAVERAVSGALEESFVAEKALLLVRFGGVSFAYVKASLAPRQVLRREGFPRRHGSEPSC